MKTNNIIKFEETKIFKEVMNNEKLSFIEKMDLLQELEIKHYNKIVKCDDCNKDITREGHHHLPFKGVICGECAKSNKEWLKGLERVKKEM